MNRTLVMSTLLLAISAALVGCTAAENPDADPGTAAQQQEKLDTSQPNAADAADDAEVKDGVMPPGARPGSANFPFPVPADWPELSPFVEEKIGKSVGMFASFQHPGSAESAASTYKALLEDAGYEVHPNPLGEQVHDASFVAEGNVNGIRFAGTLDFDTDSTGTPRVVINLTED